MLAAFSCQSHHETKALIKFWAMGAEGEHVQKLMPEFEQRHPEIRVKVQMLPWVAAHEKLLTAYAGRSLPDMCQLGNTWIPEFSLLNALENLDPWLAKSAAVKKESYFDGIWETNRIDSLLYGIPWYVDTRVLFYRKDVLAQAGFPEGPKTWEEWMIAAKRIKQQMGRRKGYPFFLPTNEYMPPIVLGMQAGSSFLRDGNRYGDFRGKEFAQAFKFYIDFFANQLAPVGITEITNLYQGFAEGYINMYISGPWNIGEFKRRLPKNMQDKWMTAPLPSPDPARFPGASLAGGSSLVMFKTSKHKAAVWKLIEFLSEPGQQIRFYQITGDLPARKEAWQDSSLQDVYVRAFFEQLNHVQPTPPVPEWEQIALKIQQYAEAAARQTMSVEQALAALDKEVDLILEKRRWMLARR
ncbi:MAG: sugar ABC transporter substrate-binding protein [candidate division KSB1 bacterium]|nr:sugar ABC transporter substrate-binding protein [candidate division KSB1 bacterium]MDZ7300973.1 sugar ABC transporter substrate-binding protein [candidate division KSB1 bacterium]MDZ7310349.1 sugar ABC transporter substrate-binding protein [candidate division KSB1 bacterium]